MSARPRNIVVGYDGSEAAGRALEAAADLTGYGARLAVVNVASGPPEEEAVRPLADARERLLRRSVEARYLEPVGEPAEALVAAARELDADLVVVGRRKSSLQRLVLGSVSAKVVRRAPCNVLVVR